MKKLLIFSVITFLSVGNLVMGQGKFSASVTQATVSNTSVLTFKLRPSATITTGFSTIEFFLRYPNSGPSITYSGLVVNTTNFPGMTGTGVTGSGSWEIEKDLAAYLLPGYHVDHFVYTAPAPNTTAATYTIATPYDVFSVNIQNAGPTVNLDFVHQNTEANVYLAITDPVGTDLRPAAFANYFFPTTSSTSGPSGSTIYYQNLVSPVPVKFGGFTATKKDNDALLKWWVENETALTDHYEVERSVNGINFTKFASVAAIVTGGSNTYNLIDFKLSSIKLSGVIYYRIKQVDKDGKAIYSEIKTVRLDGKALAASVYPNPAKDATNLSFDLIEAADVAITITDAAGKEVQKMQVQGAKGANVQKINMSTFASGAYLIKVSTAGEITTLPVVKTQ